jgi:hypothetical protein
LLYTMKKEDKEEEQCVGEDKLIIV